MTGGGGGQRLLLRPWHRWSCGWRWTLLCTVLVCLLLVPGLAWSSADSLRPYRALSGISVLADGGEHAMRSTTSVAIDSRGRVWIGGYRRLMRLDGMQVHSYPGQRTPLLPEGYIRALLPLGNGDMLIGANREGALLWELASGELVPLKVQGGQRLTRINDVVAGHAGGAWIAAEQGLFYWPGGASRTLQPVNALAGLPSLSPRVFSVLDASDGSLWVAAHNGLYRRRPGGKALLPVRSGQPVLDRRLAEESVWVLAEDGRGRVWAGLVRSGVVVIDGDQAFAPAGLDGTQGLHQGRTIRSLLWDRQRMWLGTDGRGLLACERDCRQAAVVTVNLAAYEGQRNFHVRELARAADGRIWAASDRGVFHFDPDARGIYELDVTPPGVDPRQRFNAVRSLLHDGQQRLWLGREAGELMRWDLASGQRSIVYLPPPLDASAVNALGTDGSGKLWVAGSGVAWVDPDSLQVCPAGELGQQARSQVNHMAVGDERAWLGYHDGLVEVDAQGRILRQMLSTADTGLRTTHIVALAEQGRWLWAGTPEGLHRIDLQQWRAEPLALLANPSAEQRERVDQITGLAVDGQRLWVGTAVGVFQVDVATGAVQVVAPTQGLRVHSLQVGADRRLWFSASPATIGVIDSAGQVQLYRARDGVNDGRGFHHGAVQRLPGGQLLFGTGIGVLAVDPARLPASPLPVPDLTPVITGLQIDAQRWPEGRLPQRGQGLSLQPEQQRLLVAFSALPAMEPERRQHAFMLEGHDPDWITLEPGIAPMALYGKLPPGRYTLALRVGSDETPGRHWTSRYPLEVLPAWYQRRWVHVAGIAGLILAVALLLRARDRIALRRQRQLEQLVTRRTNELQQANTQLAALAGEDALTGLYNRRRLFQHLNELIAQGQQHWRPHSLVLLDLDHFKQINDSHGHVVGDAVLRQVAARLQQALRAQDMAARYGGEELLLLLPDTTQAAALELAERLRQAIATMRVRCDPVQLSVTASFGVAQLQPGQSAEQWIERADLALYRAKRQGRNQVCADTAMG